ncbi:hypothetical protein BC939DRAFT_498822 [Gamsiella multidivaricata]|uniref:uncharacterized protein n=1 Tax=Gamsiella multidivaricata TaxID=101098 RepID=UPI00221F5238|nr:uncharacterized protein BC939DRAFT_498822 [Gamsiella multidivaricata]KAG0360400.1 hypothetical protein BGZ54_009571 [Gamsiella multidivaricata]KAI7831370.1 hypothetical protein BC939DRAFT_498822 [Gamsiella multidivaricata]
MFVLSWIRSSDTQASNASTTAPSITDKNAPSSTSPQEPEPHQDDWVFLPSDHTDLMSASVSDLDLLSASMTLYRPSTHPASSRTRTLTSETLSPSDVCSDSNGIVGKSRRQLKKEMRQQQALEELERRPRYDPTIAKMRDLEFKMAKMNKLGLRSGRILSASSGGAGGPHSGAGVRSAAAGPQ